MKVLTLLKRQTRDDTVWLSKTWFFIKLPLVSNTIHDIIRSHTHSIRQYCRDAYMTSPTFLIDVVILESRVTLSVSHEAGGTCLCLIGYFHQGLYHTEKTSMFKGKNRKCQWDQQHKVSYKYQAQVVND